jgi:hypothetical protein
MKATRLRGGAARVACLTVAMGLFVATGVWAGNVLEVGPGHAYATIQAAVNAAQPGDAIRVYPSTYPESVLVSKSHVSILAEGDGVVVGPPPQGGQPCFGVAADGVVIQGFDLTGTNCAPAIGFVGSYNRFSGNRIYGLTCPGVNALACRAPNGGSNYNVIQDNDITQADLGIILGSDAKNAVNKGNAIVGNHVHGVGAVGIAVYNAVATTIIGNVIEGIPFGMGISLGTLGGRLPQHSHVVTGNRILNVAEGGIGVFADKPATLTDVFIGFNQISSTGGWGILLQKEDGAQLTGCMVSGNDIRETDTMGIVIDHGVSKSTVQGNLTLNNGQSGIVVAGKHNTMDANTSLGNSGYDLDNRGKDNRWRDNVYQTCSWAR